MSLKTVRGRSTVMGRRRLPSIVMLALTILLMVPQALVIAKIALQVTIALMQLARLNKFNVHLGLTALRSQARLRYAQ